MTSFIILATAVVALGSHRRLIEDAVAINLISDDDRQTGRRYFILSVASYSFLATHLHYRSKVCHANMGE